LESPHGGKEDVEGGPGHVGRIRHGPLAAQMLPVVTDPDENARTVLVVEVVLFHNVVVHVDCDSVRARLRENDGVGALNVVVVHSFGVLGAGECARLSAYGG